MASPFFTLLGIPLFLAFSVLSVFSQETIQIRVCNSQKILNSHPKYLEFKKEQKIRSESLREGKLAMKEEIRALQQEIVNLREQIAGLGPEDPGLKALNEQIFELTQQGIIKERMMRDLEENHESEMEKSLLVARGEVSREVRDQIKNHEATENYDLLLDSAGAGESGLPLVLYASPRIDVTAWLLNPGEENRPKDVTSLKVAVVDTLQLYNSQTEALEISNKSRKALEDLDNEEIDQKEEISFQIDERRKTIREKREENVENPELARRILDEDLRAMERLLRKRADLNNWRKRMDLAIAERTQIEYDELKTKLRDYVREYAAREKYDLVLNRSSRGLGPSFVIVGTQDSKDITYSVNQYARSREGSASE